MRRPHREREIDITEEITKDIVAYLSRAKKPRSYDDYTIHATDVYTFCPRRFIIAKAVGANPRVYAPISSPTVLTFKIGEAIEDILIESVKSANKLFGQWKCKVCGETYIGSNVFECVSCNSKHVEYLGVTVKDNSTYIPIVGNIDIVYLSGFTNKAHIIECKSIGFSNNPNYNFDALTSPILEHVYQVNTYMYLLSNVKTEFHNLVKFDTKVAYIIYVSKLHRNSPVKMFKVKMDKKIQEEIKEMKKAIRDWDVSRKLADRTCANRMALMARNYCPPDIVDLCFRKKVQNEL